MVSPKTPSIEMVEMIRKTHSSQEKRLKLRTCKVEEGTHTRTYSLMNHTLQGPLPDIYLRCTLSCGKLTNFGCCKMYNTPLQLKPPRLCRRAH